MKISNDPYNAQILNGKIDRSFSLAKASEGLAKAVEDFDREHDTSSSLHASYWVLRHWLIQVGKERYQKVFKDYVEKGEDVSFPSEGLEAIMRDVTEEVTLYGE